ncbi:unnamed protein product, partial [Rotaria sp. Silwood1]
MGNCNIDVERDYEKADQLLEWIDSYLLKPVIPNSNISLRSNRTIDYAVTTGDDLTMQTREGVTSSNHKPLLCVFADDGVPKSNVSRT